MKIFRSITALLVLQGGFCHGAPVISEFCASNSNGIKDEDGSREDWIEIRNPDFVAVNLENWSLSDDASNKAKWHFPAVSIPAGGHLVVFASSKDRAIAGQPLHTNFALSAKGEYLGLTQPDAVTTVSEYAPKFPKQYDDISYGIPYEREDVTLIAEDAAAKWTVPTSAVSVGADWMSPGYSDAGWTSATMGLGFDRNITPVSFLPDIGSGGNLESALFGNTTTQTCYVRIPFAAPAGVVSLKLRIKYDDGFAAWINGQPLLSGGVQLKRNTPAVLAWNSTASGTHDDGPASQYEDFDVSGSLPELQPDNVLAIQFLNRNSSSSDALLRVEMVAGVINTTSALAPDYLSIPTPGSLNGGGDTVVIPRQVTFSKEPGVFSGSFGLEMGGAEAGEEIHFTTDGTMPDAGSPVYTAPVTVSSSQLIQAKLFQSSGMKSGLLTAAHYEKMEANLADYKGTGQPFRSALPILVLNNLAYNGELPNDDVKRSVQVHVYDRDGSGYSSLGNVPALSSAGNAKIRGSSSAGFVKKPYSLEFTNETGSGTDVDILGLKGEDFALVPCWSYDRTFVRNAWIFEMARQTGYWAPRTRLVELFFNQNNDNLSYDSATATDYRGVYLLTEVIRPDSDRVDITKMSSGDTSLPAISGGLILKVDRKDSDEFGWYTDRNLPPSNDGQWLLVYRPKLEDLNVAQSDHVMSYFQAFEDALYTEQAGGFLTRNYRKYIDSRSWADTHIFNMFPKNVDALRLSSYFTKDRGRPIEGGPIWDFDRSANNEHPSDNRDSDPTGWSGSGDSTDFFHYAWWDRLFSDSEFSQLYVDRWQSLRKGPLLTANINSVIDGYYQEFRCVQDPADNPGKRDFAKWYGGAGDLTTNFNQLKSWLGGRATWIDSQFVSPSAHSLAAGPITVGTSVSISSPGNRVYYTLDGTDPRAVGGGIAPGAALFNGGIPLSQTTLLTSRALGTGVYTYPATKWSGATRSLYTVNEPYANNSNLLLTGIHLNPAPASATEIAAMPEVDASDFSWLEIRNISEGPVNLDGVSLVKSRPVSAVSLAPRTLAPGEKAIIVKNREAFTFRYGSGPATKIAGEWPRDKHLGFAEGDIRLLARDGIVRIADFTYESQWIGLAAVTAGNAMEYISQDSSTSGYETAGNWRPSADVGGSPGEIAPEGYLAWQLEMFPGETERIGSLDDFDGDGLANLIEYLLGSDPTEFTTSPGTVTADEQGDLVMDYTRRVDRTDAVLSVWQSTGLDLWEPAEVDELVSTVGVIEHRRARFPAGGTGFLRFKGVAN